jgi:hypothetical protein
MGRPLYTNNAATYLAFGITNTATTMQVSANAGGLFPNPVGGDYFYVSLISLSGPIIEIVKCTARNGDIFTIERGQEGTSPLYWNTGDNVQLRITAAGMNYITGATATTTEEESQVATQGQTIFTLTTFDYAPGTNNLAVFVNGSKQVAGLNYTETAINTVTFLNGLNAGDVVEFILGLTIATGTLYATDIKYNPQFTNSVTTTVEKKLQESISVKDFGAVGDGVTDDTVAIQNALNYVGSTGGGTVYLPKTNGNYRITSGLRIPSYVTLEGSAVSGYPYNGSSTGSSLVANFTNANQWVIDSATTSGGNPIAYNAFITNLPDGDTFNCTVKNLEITVSGSVVPYGGIRMQGCPGSVVDNVSVVGTGTGLLVNCCFLGSYKFNCIPLYYGIVAWNSCNGNYFDVHANLQTPTSTVPSGYLLPFMNSLNGVLVPSYKLNTNSYYNSTIGMIVGGDGTVTSVSNNILCVVEQFTVGVFLAYAYATVFNELYVEADTNVCTTAFVSAFSRFTISSLHAYLSGTGNAVDMGTSNNGDISPTGIIYTAGYGYGPYNDYTSLVTINNVKPNAFGPSTPQPQNLVYTSGSQDWVSPSLINSWVSASTPNTPAGYRVNARTGNVELQGLVSGGSSGTIAFTLPAGYRPLNSVYFATNGGGVEVTAGGSVYITGTTVGLNGVFFAASL